MPRRPPDPLVSPTLAETAAAQLGRSARQISVQGFGPANRVLAGIVAIALAIGAALPVHAGTDDLATGLAALGAAALIAGETGGAPLDNIAAPRTQRALANDDRADGGRDRVASACSRDIGPPYGNAWGYRARHGCAPAPGHHGHGPEHRGKDH